MTETGIAGIFESHAFLARLSHQHRMILASGARPFSVARGDFLAREGAEANAFFLVQSGRVAIELHHPTRGAVAIQTIGPGEVVGWSWIVPGSRWQFDCHALDTVQGLVLDAHWLREKCEQDHELGYHLLKQLVSVIASRLTATRLQLVDIYK